MVRITHAADVKNLEHINQIQFELIKSLQKSNSELQLKLEHLEQLLRFNPIILKGKK